MPRKKAAAATHTSKKRKEPESNGNDEMQDDATEEPAAKKQKVALGKPPKFTKARLKKYFEKYKDEENQVGPEGMIRLCEDAQVDPEDVAMLVLAWKVGAQRMGFFSEEEFMQGFEKLKIDCPEALNTELETLRAELPKVRSQVYTFAFEFGKESPEKKTIDLDVVSGFLNLLMPQNPHTTKFIDFLGKQTSYRAMSSDHWKMWYEFANTVGIDFKEYDVMAAWPSIIDEYVEAMQKSQS